MKPFPLLALLLFLPVAAFADPFVTPDFGDGHFVKTFPPAKEKPWNIAGTWFVTHTVWNGPLIFTPDGLIHNPQNKPEGQWILTVQEGQMHLVIRWNKWTADNLAMLNGDEFYGSDGRSEIWLRRDLPAVASTTHALGGSVETYAWHQGEPPVKLIKQDEGFCALTSVTGHFQGGGEIVKVYVAEDGYWYLGGHSMQRGVAAECVVVRYRGAVKPVAEASEEEEIVAPLATPPR